MGLGASGKSSIRSVVFEGKSPEDVKDYQATINYKRSKKQIIDSPFMIFDCGGQNIFISDFIDIENRSMTAETILCGNG